MLILNYIFTIPPTFFLKSPELQARNFLKKNIPWASENILQKCRSPILKVRNCISGSFFIPHFRNWFVCLQYCGSANYNCVCPPPQICLVIQYIFACGFHQSKEQLLPNICCCHTACWSTAKAQTAVNNSSCCPAVQISIAKTQSTATTMGDCSLMGSTAQQGAAENK